MKHIARGYHVSFAENGKKTIATITKDGAVVKVINEYEGRSITMSAQQTLVAAKAS
jgi:hypothetical protein